jgi:hypothetical protein
MTHDPPEAAFQEIIRGIELADANYVAGGLRRKTSGKDRDKNSSEWLADMDSNHD